MMFANDDRDVKIFGQEPNKTEQESKKALLLEIDEQHRNGNIALAEMLGRAFADELLSTDFITRFGCADDGNDDTICSTVINRREN